MIHIYAVVSSPNIAEAITKGRTDYDQPRQNRSVRYSLDETKVIVEGDFTDEEKAWFDANSVLVGDVSEILAYITANRLEWETSFE